ncbi:hydroperoxide isomerase ALOXE3-like, partial [Anarrhichthys ocellatus]|uniref:hydroperoxide isomerase ALOXE3-like n=1 Tax=Anarrhichthys ocellatus TaxID=433405 RepID=UPI0012EECC52
WDEYIEGLSYTLNISDPKALPAEIGFSFSKAFEFRYRNEATSADLELKGLKNSTEQFESFEEMKMVSWFKKSPLSEYMSEHWKDDDFFGYQLLNGVNPYVIQRCLKMPSNFPVTEEMVKPFLANGSSLTAEITKGNIFITDYKIMEGLPTRVIDGKPVAVTAALYLLYLNPEKKLRPIAIQLGQQPSEETPIFLPTDLETDWLLAKIYVRNVDALYHQLISHLQNTHLLAEVFTMATLRNLPKIHPLNKLLIQFYNAIIQSVLVWMSHQTGGNQADEAEQADWGTRRVIQTVGTGRQDSFHRLTMTEYKLEVTTGDRQNAGTWDHIFITLFGTEGQSERTELDNFGIDFTTGTFDYYSWVPNGSILLRKPPPTTKGQSSMKTILETLPDVDLTVRIAAMVWLLNHKYTDMILMGSYPEERFHEPAPKQMMKEFQAELSDLSEAISTRNLQLEIPYRYLNPTEIENSVAN